MRTSRLPDSPAIAWSGPTRWRSISASRWRSPSGETSPGTTASAMSASCCSCWRRRCYRGGGWPIGVHGGAWRVRSAAGRMVREAPRVLVLLSAAGFIGAVELSEDWQPRLRIDALPDRRGAQRPALAGEQDADRQAPMKGCRRRAPTPPPRPRASTAPSARGAAPATSPRGRAGRSSGGAPSSGSTSAATSRPRVARRPPRSPRRAARRRSPASAAVRAHRAGSRCPMRK